MALFEAADNLKTENMINDNSQIHLNDSNLLDINDLNDQMDNDNYLISGRNDLQSQRN